MLRRETHTLIRSFIFDYVILKKNIYIYPYIKINIHNVFNINMFKHIFLNLDKYNLYKYNSYFLCRLFPPDLN